MLSYLTLTFLCYDVCVFFYTVAILFLVSEGKEHYLFTLRTLTGLHSKALAFTSSPATPDLHVRLVLSVAGSLQENKLCFILGVPVALYMSIQCWKMLHLNL